jgi:hypothetical protein
MADHTAESGSHVLDPQAMAVHHREPRPPLNRRYDDDRSLLGRFKRNWSFIALIMAIFTAGWAWRGKIFGSETQEAVAAVQGEAVAKTVDEDHHRIDAMEVRQDVADSNLRVFYDEMLREHQEENLWVRQLANGKTISEPTATPIPFVSPTWTVPSPKPTQAP